MAETTTVVLIAPNGQQVRVATSKQADRLGAGYRLPGKRSKSPDTESPKGVENMNLVELKAEIDKRNADREDDAKLSKTGDKAALVATLKADDEAQASAAGASAAGKPGSASK